MANLFHEVGADTAARGVIEAVRGGGRRGTEGETETKGREGVREGQTGGR